MIRALATACRAESPRNCTARYRRTRHNTRLEGGCQVPIGSYAELIEVKSGCVRWSARRTVRRLFAGTPRCAAKCRTNGDFAGRRALNNGAREILAEVYNGDAPAWYPCHPPVSRWRRVSEPSAHMGQVAWHFPLIEFSPGRQLPNLLINWQRWGRAICCLPSRKRGCFCPITAASARS